ncbi:MAG: hypothetical protein OHK0023_09600 [Anaerolineae bacterium]
MIKNAAIQAVDLRQDELAFVMTLYGLEEIGGFRVPADFDANRAAQAGATLVERGYTRAEDASAITASSVLSADLATLIQGAAGYSVAVGVSRLVGNAPDRFWCYVTPNHELILQTRPQNDIERFELIPDTLTLKTRLSQMLNAYSDEMPGDFTFFAPKQSLSQAERLRAHQGLAAAQNYLGSTGFPATFADVVLDEQRQIILVTLALKETEDGFESQSHTAMLIRANNGFWLMEEDEINPDQLAVSPVDSATAVGFIVAQTRPRTD